MPKSDNDGTTTLNSSGEDRAVQRGADGSSGSDVSTSPVNSNSGADHVVTSTNSSGSDNENEQASSNGGGSDYNEGNTNSTTTSSLSADSMTNTNSSNGMACDTSSSNGLARSSSTGQSNDPLGLLDQSSYFTSAVREVNRGTNSRQPTISEAQRRQQRLECNRRSAKLARHRRKILMDSLTESVHELQQVNTQLKMENTQLKQFIVEQKSVVDQLLALQCSGKLVEPAPGLMDNNYSSMKNATQSSTSTSQELQMINAFLAQQQSQLQTQLMTRTNTLESELINRILGSSASSRNESFNSRAMQDIFLANSMEVNNNNSRSLNSSGIDNHANRSNEHSDIDVMSNGPNIAESSQPLVLNAANVQRLQSLLMAQNQKNESGGKFSGHK